MNNWQTIDKLEKIDKDVLLYSEEWINEEYNPTGIRIGYKQHNNYFCTAKIDIDGDYLTIEGEQEKIFPTHFHELKFNLPQDKNQLKIFNNE